MSSKNTLIRLPKLWRVRNALARLIGPAEGPDLQFNLDSIKISHRGAFIVEGWLFNFSQRGIDSLHLVARTSTGEKQFECKLGLSRPDVQRYYEMPQALHSGFSAIGNLGSKKIRKLLFRVRHSDGRTETIKAPGSRVHFLDGGSTGQGQTDLRELLLQATPDERQSGAASRPTTLIFDHNLGGGANYYRSGLIERLIKQGQAVLLVYYNLAKLEYNVEYLNGAITRQIQIGSLETLATLSSLIKLETILINNLYFYEDPLDAIRLILKIKEHAAARLIMIGHDYHCVCPEINLMNQDERFCGVPDLSVCRSCLPVNRSDHLRFLPQTEMPIWREVWGNFLNEADEINCSSNSTISLIRRAYPLIEERKFKLQPHVVDYLPSRRPVVDLTQDLHLGVVGEISANKGARVVEELAELISAWNLPVKLTIIGNIIASRTLAGVQITGPYRREELPELIEKLGINVCLFPSIWPETFSYVAQELMILGLPLAVYNLGAPAERVAGYAKGLILSEVGNARSTLDELIAFHHQLRGDPAKVS